MVVTGSAYMMIVVVLSFAVLVLLNPIGVHSEVQGSQILDS